MKPQDFLPARWIPLLYLGLAHASLAVALAVVAVDPGGVAGFYYHPRLVAVVHMVTLGWISGSILGALYLVGPLAFRTSLLARRGDYIAFASFAIGVVGMVSHFWIESLSGMAWSALLVLASLGHVGARVVRGLRHAPVPVEARLPVGLSFLNVLIAAVVGILLGINKTSPFLPGSQLMSALGHAHLAVVGWAVMMVMGVGYRLLPMILPAAMPRGIWPHVGTALTQVGALGVFLAFLAGGQWVFVFAPIAAGGVGVFLAQVIRMVRHRRPGPTDMPRPDLSLGHAAQALVYLALSCVLGVWLALAPTTETTLRLVMAYGVFGLVGFLSQMVVGVAGRLLPLYGWLWGFADRNQAGSPPSLHRAPSRRLQGVVLALWTFGVPALAAGLALDRHALISCGAGALGVAVVVEAMNAGIVLKRLWTGASGRVMNDPATGP